MFFHSLEGWMPLLGIKVSHVATALDVHASELFELAEFDPPPDGFLVANLHQLNSGPRPVGTTFPPDRPRPCSRNQLRKFVSCN